MALPLLINPLELQQSMQAQAWLIFDVRHDLADLQAGRRAYEAGHIPGALHLDHERQLSAARTGHNGRHPLPRLEDFAQLMHEMGLRPGLDVVIYDASGGTLAARLWWMLRWLGHDRVCLLDGGWQAWLATGAALTNAKADGLPQNRAQLEGRNRRIRVIPNAAAMPTLDADAVMANLERPVYCVLDARAAERYRGEVEPMDPVAGHIPGALNRSCSLNLGSDGRFKPAAQLRQEFLALLDGRKAEHIVHQCGSGITACHNLFAMELAGLTGSALYPGSWSEWCSDPRRPVAKSA